MNLKVEHMIIGVLVLALLYYVYSHNSLLSDFRGVPHGDNPHLKAVKEKHDNCVVYTTHLDGTKTWFQGCGMTSMPKALSRNSVDAADKMAAAAAYLAKKGGAPGAEAGLVDFCDALLSSARDGASDVRDATLDVFTTVLGEVEPVPDVVLLHEAQVGLGGGAEVVVQPGRAALLAARAEQEDRAVLVGELVVGRSHQIAVRWKLWNEREGVGPRWPW